MSLNLAFNKNFINSAMNKNMFYNRILVNTIKKNNLIKTVNKILSKRFSINLNKDYYKILEITPDASEKDIKNAYICLVKKYHPDVTGGKTTEHFKELSNSFLILSDKSTKNFYDANSEKVSRHYYSTTAFDGTKNSNTNNKSEYYDYNEPDDKSKTDFYNKYKNKEYYRYKNYYEDHNSNYYQDPKGNSSYSNKFNNIPFRDLLNDYFLVLPKIVMFILLYVIGHLITNSTKNEYHFFDNS